MLRNRISRVTADLLFFGAPRVATLRASGLVLHFVFTLVAARALGEHVAGNLFSQYAAALLAASVCRFGGDQLLVLSARQRSWGASRAVLGQAALRTLGIFAAVALLLHALDAAGLWHFGLPAIALTLAIALSWLAVGALRGAGAVPLSVICEVILPFGVTTAFLLAAPIDPARMDADVVLSVLAAGFAVSAALGFARFALLGRQAAPGSAEAAADGGAAALGGGRQAMSLWVLSAINTAIQWLPVILAERLIDASASALVAVSQRYGALLLFGLSVGNTQFAREYAIGHADAGGGAYALFFRDLWRQLPFAVVGGVALMALAAPVLAAHELSGSVSIFQLVVLGYVVNACCGPIVTFLSMTGGIATAVRIGAAWLLFSMGAHFLLAPLGLFAFAAAGAAANAGLNLSLLSSLLLRKKSEPLAK
jgi:hypothetical protein